MSREEETAFILAIRKPNNVQETHAALELLPLPPNDPTTEDPTTLEGLWSAILQEKTVGGPENRSS